MTDYSEFARLTVDRILEASHYEAQVAIVERVLKELVEPNEQRVKELLATVETLQEARRKEALQDSRDE
jgi:hypothetical protein